jgi:hypothetical protein
LAITSSAAMFEITFSAGVSTRSSRFGRAMLRRISITSRIGPVVSRWTSTMIAAQCPGYGIGSQPEQGPGRPLVDQQPIRGVAQQRDEVANRPPGPVDGLLRVIPPGLSVFSSLISQSPSSPSKKVGSGP